jgi:purine-binding chemotaxis protein CheW
MMNLPITIDSPQQPLITATRGLAQFTQEKLAILKARAYALAQVPEETESPILQLEITEFRLGDETYACASSSVREVYQLKGLTSLPCTPAFILGIINIRGQILPVIDVKPLLGLPSPLTRELGKVVILHAEGMEIGLLVDTIVGVRAISTSILYPPLPTLTELQIRYIRGITSDGTILLDAVKLLTSSRLGNPA